MVPFYRESQDPPVPIWPLFHIFDVFQDFSFPAVENSVLSRMLSETLIKSMSYGLCLGYTSPQKGSKVFAEFNIQPIFKQEEGP